ncbi:MAG: immune inhibitor A, partial [Anaerolineae bacterium]|nr:immune inhibitor A [Anaerolineae bacterium]
MGNQNKLIIGIIIIIVLLLGTVTCCVCLSAGLLTIQLPNPTATLPPEVDLPPPPITGGEDDINDPPDVEVGLPEEAFETLAALEEAIIPVVDLHELGIRYRGVSPNTPRVISESNPDFDVGTVRTFSVSNLDSDTTFEIQTELLYKTQHVYMWVEAGLDADIVKVREAADLFEEHTYPTNRAFFGEEWSPGVDGDPHLSILHARNLGSTVAGYFSSADSFVQAVREDSNEMEMFYIHIDRSMDIGDDFYNGVLAHEFQHMIHWYNDRNETTWMNEGCSELAMELNDRTYSGGRGLYDVGGSEYAYLDNPDTQLTTWPEVDMTGSAAAHYGASYLFMSYFLDRFGEEATKSLVSHPENGMESVNQVVQTDLGLTLTHEDIVADWIIANLLDDTSLEDGRFGYHEIDILSPDIDKSYTRSSQFPVDATSTVSQYGVDYFEIRSDKPVNFAFSGTSEVGLMNTNARSGKYLWWSNREDESDSRLSYILNLTTAETAAVNFWTWYHIEEDWDYAYVVVGTTDSGAIPGDLMSTEINWTILDDSSLGCTTADPNK